MDIDNQPKTVMEMYNDALLHAKHLRETTKALIHSNDWGEAIRRVGEAVNVLSALPPTPDTCSELEAWTDLTCRMFFRLNEEPSFLELEADKVAILELLKARTISSVEIFYGGSNDVKQISGISASFADEGKNLDLLLEPGQKVLSERLQDFTWKVLDLDRPGFQKKLGGFGQITIDAKEGAAQPFTLMHAQAALLRSFLEL